MFTAGEIQFIRKKCWTEFCALLNKISIPVPNFSIGDEYNIYDRIDNELEKKLGGMMKSPSAVEGYTRLLKLGGIPFDYSELDSELLAKVIDNKDKILSAVRQNIIRYNSWQTKYEDSPKNETQEIIELKITGAENFNTFDLRKELVRAKNSLSHLKGDPAIKANVEFLISQSSRQLSTNPLLSIKGWQNWELDGIEDKLRHTALRQLREGETTLLCLQLKKVVKHHEIEIPPAPPESEFSVGETEYILEILTQLNEIILLKG